MVSATSCPTVRSAGGRGAGSSGIERLQEPRQRLAQKRESVLEPPAAPVRLADLVHDGADLEGRNSGELAGAEHGEPLHRLDLTSRRAADARSRADRTH